MVQMYGIDVISFARHFGAINERGGVTIKALCGQQAPGTGLFAGGLSLARNLKANMGSVLSFMH
jgi:hypothetical protein